MGEPVERIDAIHFAGLQLKSEIYIARHEDKLELTEVVASGTCGELTAGGKLALVEIRHMPVGRQIFALWRRSSPYSRDFETLTIEISSLMLQQEDQPLEETGHP